jgi:nitrous oxidase accessory protein NosD
VSRTYAQPITVDKEIILRSTGGAGVTTLQTPGVALMIARSAVTVDGFTIESDATAVSAENICPVGQAVCASPGERGSNLTISNNVIRSSAVGLTWSGKIDCVVIADNAFDANGRHIELVQTGVLAPALLVNITDNDITNGGSSGSAVTLSGMLITFAANTVEGSAASGVRVDMAPAGMQLLENDIDGNAGDGITVGAGGVAVRIQDNNITNNGVGLGNEATSGVLDATENWLAVAERPKRGVPRRRRRHRESQRSLHRLYRIPVSPLPAGIPERAGGVWGRDVRAAPALRRHQSGRRPGGRLHHLRVARRPEHRSTHQRQQQR